MCGRNERISAVEPSVIGCWAINKQARMRKRKLSSYHNIRPALITYFSTFPGELQGLYPNDEDVVKRSIEYHFL